MAADQRANTEVFHQLRQRWTIVATASLIALGGCFLFLAFNWEPIYAARWLLLSSTTVLYLLWIFWRHLDRNHRQGETQLLPTLGWGNLLTLTRGMLTACLLGFLFSPIPPGWLVWIPGVLYTLVCAADFLDGYLARITNHVTQLGDKLDTSFDGLGVLGAVLLAVQYGQVPAWYLIIGLARYLFLAGIYIRQRRGYPVHQLPASISRRVLAGFQMGFLAVILWPIFSPPGTHIAAFLFGFPFLIGFGYDWLRVSGISLTWADTSLLKLHNLLLDWLPLGLRTLVLVLSMPLLIDGYRSFPTLKSAMGLLIAFQAIAILLLVIGIASRTTTVFGLLLLGVNQILSGLTPLHISLAVVFTTILFIGSGLFSLWSPEDKLIYRRAGE